MHSELADEIAERGYITAVGTITGTTASPGQATAQINCDFPKLTRAAQQTGGNSVTLTVDVETARFLPLFAKVEIALRVLPGDE